jgi:hypothetical protein
MHYIHDYKCQELERDSSEQHPNPVAQLPIRVDCFFRAILLPSRASNRTTVDDYPSQPVV